MNGDTVPLMFNFPHLRAEHEDVPVSDVLLAPLTDVLSFVTCVPVSVADPDSFWSAGSGSA